MSEHKRHAEEERETEAAAGPAAGEAVSADASMRGAWPVFKEAFAAWKKHWRFLTAIQVTWAAVFLATIIVGAVAIGFATASSGIFSGAMTPKEVGQTLLSAPGLMGIIIVGALIVAAILVVISTWMSLATVQAWVWVKREEHDQMSVRRAYGATWELVPGFIWVSILAIALTLLGLFGLVIPGIMLAVAFSLLSTVVVLERRTGRQAIMRTTSLARPYLLTLFWRMLVTGVVLYVPAELAAGVINSTFDGLGDALNQMYGLVVSPIMAGVLLLTYHEMKAADRKRKYLVTLSLERIALIGAAIAAVALGVILLANRG